ncbi:o-succinylbenzoate--CoA ligase [Bombilactobacillus bombi]|uniref:2-succinylbenzoate--CoA ligase n=1 Tax=Bombilactobacillus bombi TaxID=1303590 RepID=A0A3R6WBI4_9LACO|nr:o-succinylbenzoate--CoA ligase [Bombilactobacillus bombi]RHW52078.1 o-succinylbenzoate--CoA ligase [Bombilactobacillus bombi]
MENWLNKRAQLSPHKIAVVYQNQKFTFAQVLQTVQQVAQRLKGLGLKPKQPVAIFGRNNLETYYNILALQQLSLPIVFLNIRLAAVELQYQVNNSQIQACLVDSTLENSAIAQVNNLRIITQQDLQQAKPTFYEVHDIESSQIASMMYTSGTTGHPKGVLQTWSNHWHSAMNTMLNFQITENDAWLCTVPLFHISGFSILLRSLIFGITIYLEPKFDVQRCQHLLINEPITIFSVVPTMLKQLLTSYQSTQPYNTQFRIMFLGGGPIDPQTLKLCQQFHIPTVQSYGMTETCSNVVALKPEDAVRKSGSSGQALFTNQIRIADKQTIGEIQLKSPALAVGYWQQMELYHSKFTKDGWYCTGDVGYLDSQGYLFVKGRLDDMFISGGENIFPNEVENVYHQLSAIADIVVTSLPNDKYGAVPIAYLTSNQHSLSNATLRAFGQQNLAHYKVPVEFRQIAHFPRTGSGKIQRNKLRFLKFKLL